ncbi:uncharacterized protein LOC111452178 isoform X2 [Cucurbita moschata]|uniref:Uncharacterized protein LOC111452178 isoform X2 n=1 Tax=Cucurbita moschata TaxID=3662 RepID=A0A6J1G9F6_CUCMO|nr:uncharacterized protein LOC111452178 isoform X2 [Cucurbita moschata]
MKATLYPLLSLRFSTISSQIILFQFVLTTRRFESAPIAFAAVKVPFRHSELSAASHLPPLVVYETAALALTLAIKQLSGGGCDSIGVCKSLKALSLWTRDEVNWRSGISLRSIMILAQRNHSGDLEDANEALGLHLQRYAFLTKDHFDSAATLYSTALKFDPSIRLQNHSRRDSVPCIHNKF